MWGVRTLTKQEGMLDLIAELPWQVGVVLSALTYVGMRWGVALLLRDGALALSIVNVSATLAPWFALAMLMASGVSALREARDRNRDKTEQRAKIAQGIGACPRCGSELVLRTARKGANAGGKFWGCSAYPKCRHTQEYVS